MVLERLQKTLAASGLGSRRSCEELILQGRVTVDGCVVAELGAKADADTQDVRCDGEPVRPGSKLYYLVNKPRGYVSTSSDEYGRPRVLDLLPARDQRLFTVGRLDADTEGLMIVTNDGAFCQRVSHPRHGVTKMYLARVQGAMRDAAKRELTSGIWLTDRRCRAVWVKVRKKRAMDSLVEITMQEGRNREVRRMLAKVGHKVIQLRRIRIGAIEDPALPLGKWRKLRADEIKTLLEGHTPSPARRHAKRKRPPRKKNPPKGKQ